LIATLTGAVIIALGDLNTAVNDQRLVDEIIESVRWAKISPAASHRQRIQQDDQRRYRRHQKISAADAKAGTIISAVFIRNLSKKREMGAPRHRRCSNRTMLRHLKDPTAIAVRTRYLVEKSR